MKGILVLLIGVVALFGAIVSGTYYLPFALP